MVCLLFISLVGWRAGILQLHTVFQPIVNLDTNEIIGFEALLRSSVPPAILFKQAEEKGVLPQLDRYARLLALRSYQLVSSPTLL